MPVQKRTKRSDGRFQRTLSYTDADGTKRRKSFYGATQKEAADKLKAAQDRLAKGAPVKDATRTLTDWLTYWYDTGLKASNRAPKTKAMHQQLTRSHVIPCIGAVTLDKLKPADVQKFLLTMTDAGYAPNTRRNTYNALRAALDDAVTNGLLAANPAHKIDRPAVPRSEAPSLSVPEVKALLSAAASSRNEPVLRFILYTGVRRGEALGLRWVDIDWNRKEAKVRGTKTTDSYRTISLSGAAVTVLKDVQKRQEAERTKAANVWTETGLAFTTALGTGIGERNLNRTLETVSKTAKVKATPHTLRHTYATTALLNGVPLHVVSRNLGHASIRITADIYGHLTDEAAAQAAEAVSAAYDL
ncbi:tyrosine-type recombinase/integrase [Naumannella halotolerans]|uniref:tyrosine-type recombinase/integrase n=1 Tax=Naumannella halotolerans TaxID=993414 RepID=UPI00370D71B7